MEVKVSTHPVEIYTASYQISGEMQPIGSFGTYINDVKITAFRVVDATLLPLMADARLGEMKLPEVYVYKREVQVILVGNFTPADAKLMPKPMPLVVFTGTYAVRGVFYGGAESRPGDIFEPAGPFFPITQFEIFNLRPLMTEVSGAFPIAYINKDAIAAYHPTT